jgi:excisionase family DNA binding protein
MRLNKAQQQSISAREVAPGKEMQMTLSSVPNRQPRLPGGGSARKQPERSDRPAVVGVGLNRGLLRVEEAAEWLGLSRTKAYELVYRGTLPSVTIGRSRRVPVAALQAFVDGLVENGGVL